MKELSCEYCSRLFIPTQNHPHYKYCSIKCSEFARIKRINIPIKIGQYTFDKNKLVIIFNNKKLDKKRKFEFKCEGCDTIFNTTLNYLNKKEIKNRWLCRSCSVKKLWKKDEYAQNHIVGYLKSWSPERRNNSRELMKNNWKNKKFRKKVLNILNDPIIKQKSLTNRKYNRINEYGVSFRSTYEYRFATALNKLGVEWKFEPRYFRLKSFDNKIYFPDFYLPKYNMWIEVKGYFTKLAKQKFEMFIKDYPDIKIKVFYLDNIKEIEKGNIREIIT